MHSTAVAEDHEPRHGDGAEDKEGGDGHDGPEAEHAIACHGSRVTWHIIHKAQFVGMSDDVT